MKEKPEENNTKVIEIKEVFYNYLKKLILTTCVVLVESHFNKV